MRLVPEIVEPAADVNQLARAIMKEHIALQDCERGLDAAERKTAGLREQQREHRLTLGRMLLDAKRAIKHGGWLPYLEKLGIPRKTANEWMREAGFVEAKSKSPASADDGDLNSDTFDRMDREFDEREYRSSRRASGVDTRPRKSDPPTRDPDDAPTRGAITRESN